MPNDPAAKRVAQRAYYAKNRARILERERQRYAAKREEIKAKAQAYRDANREKVRAWHRENHWANRDAMCEKHNLLKLKRYGMTPQVYAAMFAAQGGVCALCGKPETRKYRKGVCRLHIDHDHVTGKVRALLCGKCNSLLGLAYDDAALLRKAADYLDSHGTQPKHPTSVGAAPSAQSPALPLFDAVPKPVGCGWDG